FQAEDGIRDGHVTGVQTCALPIFAPLAGFVIETAGGLFVFVTVTDAFAVWVADGAAPVIMIELVPAAAVVAAVSVSVELPPAVKIGRASCRERVWSAVGGGALKEE